MTSIPGPIRCKNVVKVSFQKPNTGGLKTSQSHTLLNDGPDDSESLPKVEKKLRPQIHPSLSTDSLSSICDNIDRAASQDPEDAPSNSFQHKKAQTIRPPKVKQLKNIQQLILQYQQTFSSSHKQSSKKLAQSSSSIDIPYLYLIDANWLRKWLKYVMTPVEDQATEPGPISNWSLVDAAAHEPSTPDHLSPWQQPKDKQQQRVAMSSAEYQEVRCALAPGLGEGEDFFLVPSEAWNALYHWYGGGPPLPRFFFNSLRSLASSPAAGGRSSGAGGRTALPLALPLLALLFEFPRISPQEKKWLTASASEEITFLSREHLAAAYETRNPSNPANPSPSEEEKGVVGAEEEQEKLLRADLYPVGLDELPAVADLLAYSHQTAPAEADFDHFLGLEDVGLPSTPGNSLPSTPTRPKFTGSSAGSGALSPKRLRPNFEAIPEAATAEEESPTPTVTGRKTLTAPPVPMPRLPGEPASELMPPPPPRPPAQLPSASLLNDTAEPSQPKPLPQANPNPSSHSDSKEKEKEKPAESESAASVVVAVDHCVVCGEISKSRCSQCGLPTYCSRDCQKLHWKFHKNCCKALKDKYAGLALGKASLAEKKAAMAAADQLILFGRQGKVGFHNLGNSCYMNSSLQCLLHVAPLTRYLLSSKFLADINLTNRDGTRGELIKSYASLAIDSFLDGSKAVQNPAAFKRMIGSLREEFAGFHQQDAHELIEFLLDKLHEDVNRVASKPYTLKLEGDGSNDIAIARDTFQRLRQRDDSFVRDLFGSLMRSQLTCPTCGRVSVSFEYHNTLQVAIPRNYSLAVTVLFVAEIPSTSHLRTARPGLDFSLAQLARPASALLGAEGDQSAGPTLWEELSRPQRLVLTVDRYQSLGQLKKQVLGQLSPALRLFFEERNVFLFESIFGPSKRLPGRCKPMKFLRDGLLVNQLAANSLLVAYGLCLQAEPAAASSSSSSSKSSGSGQSFVFLHLRGLEEKQPAPAADVEEEDGEEVSAVFAGYPLLLSVDSGWRVSRLRYHLWLNALRLLSPASAFVRESLAALAASQITSQVERSEFLPFRLLSNEGGPALSPYHRRLPGRIRAAKEKLLRQGRTADASTEEGREYLRLLAESSDNLLGSPLPKDKLLTFGEFIEDIGRQYSSEVVNFSVDVQLTAQADLIDFASFKALDTVVTPKGTASTSSSASYAAAAGKNGPGGQAAGGQVLTLEDCLKEYTKEEVLDQGNEWYCSACREHKQAHKIVHFSAGHLPAVLVLTLKRFEYRDISALGGGAGLVHREKIEAFVDFPLVGLNLRPYCGHRTTSAAAAGEGRSSSAGQRRRRGRLPSIDETYGQAAASDEPAQARPSAGTVEEEPDEDDEEAEDEENDALYDLFAICNHYGRMGFGHYTATVKDWPLYEEVTGGTALPRGPGPTSGTSGGDWFLYDDNAVTKLPEKAVKTSSAYILFYKKRSLS